jgi:hypothetical protein
MLRACLLVQLSSVRESLQEQIDHRCQELSANCRSRAAEQAGQLADQAKQMEPALLKLTQQVRQQRGTSQGPKGCSLRCLLSCFGVSL